MPVLETLEGGQVPVKVWTMEIEASARQQLANIAKLPKQLGALVDLACALSVPYVLEVPIDGYETLWAIRIWFAKRFPHEAIRYRTLPSRCSIEPQHNPKRIRRDWKHRVESGFSKGGIFRG